METLIKGNLCFFLSNLMFPELWSLPKIEDLQSVRVLLSRHGKDFVVLLLKFSCLIPRPADCHLLV